MGWLDRVSIFNIGKGNNINISQKEKNTINGKIIVDNDCNNISIEEDGVFLDGINITESLPERINITIVINGSVENVTSNKYMSLNVDGDIKGDISLGSGDITSSNINGDINIEENGNIITKKLKGNVNLQKDGQININGILQGNISVNFGDVNVNGNVNDSVFVDNGKITINENVKGDVSINTGSLTCSDVKGNVSINTGNLTCSDIKSGISINEGNVSAGDILGSVDLKRGEVKADDIRGRINVGEYGFIKCNTLSGNVKMEDGEIYCEDTGYLKIK